MQNCTSKQIIDLQEVRKYLNVITVLVTLGNIGKIQRRHVDVWKSSRQIGESQIKVRDGGKGEKVDS